MPVAVHKSKIDTWIAVVLLISPGLILVLAVLRLIEGALMEAAIMAGLLAFLVALCALFVFPMRYELTDDALVVRLGLLRLRYPYGQMREVFRTHNPISGYALSLDRLQVVYRTPNGRRGFILISPRSRTLFLEDLSARTPEHELVDGRLVRLNRSEDEEPAEPAPAMAGE